MILNLPKLGLVRFDDNLTSEELSQQLTALSQKYGFQFEQPERGLGTLLGHGVMRGAKQMGSALFDVIPALGASALGFDEYAKKQMQEAAETQAEIERKYPAQFKPDTEVGSPYEALQYGAETLGELVPTALGMFIPGGIAGGIGRAAATRGAMAAAESVGPLSLAGREAAMLAAEKAGVTAGKYAGYAGAYLGSYAQNTPEIFQNIYEETGKFEPMVAALAGGLSSILDSFVPGKLLKKLGPAGRLQAAAAMARDSGAAPSVWKAIAKEASKAAVAEGLTESAQEAISVLAEQVAGSTKDFLDPKNVQRYKESFIKGAIGGAAFGVVGGGVKGLRERAEIKKQEAAEARERGDEERAKQLEAEADAASAEIEKLQRQTTPEERDIYGVSEETGPYSPTQAFGPIAPKEFKKQEKQFKEDQQTRREEIEALSPESYEKEGMPRLVTKKGQLDLVSQAERPSPIEQTLQKAVSPLEQLQERGMRKGELNLEEMRRIGWNEEWNTLVPNIAELAQPEFRKALTSDVTIPVETRKGIIDAGKKVTLPDGKTAVPKSAKYSYPVDSSLMDDLRLRSKEVFGFAPTASVWKKLEGLDAKNPEHVPLIRSAFSEFAEKNPGRATKIEQYLDRLPPTPTLIEGVPDATGLNQQPSGGGAGVPSEGVAGTTTGALGPTKRRRVDTPTGYAGQPTRRKIEEPSALTPQEQAAETQFFGEEQVPIEERGAMLRRKERRELTPEELRATPTEDQQISEVEAGAPVEPVSNKELKKIVKDFFGSHYLDPDAHLYLPKYEGPAFDETQRRLAESGDINGLIRNLLDSNKDPAIKQVLRRIRSLNLKTKLEIGDPTGELNLESPAFRNWFGDSKVVDAQGNPLRVYHGTADQFDRFTIKSQGKTFSEYEGSFPRTGFWFTSDPKDADWYSAVAARNKGGEGRQTMPVYLSLQNPYVVSAEDFASEGEYVVPEVGDPRLDGHDGMIVPIADYNDNGEIVVKRTHYVAFRPEQIKSAIGNIGTYSAESPDIRYAANKAGSYDPPTDTITLDPNQGLNAHTFIHEVLHAAISKVLSNKNHPLTKEFEKFFMSIKDRLGDAYGGTNLQEFAAELISNPSFQATLKAIKAPRSESMFMNILRKIAEFFGFAKESTAFTQGLKFIDAAIDISGDVEAAAGERMFLTGDFAPIKDINNAMPSLVGRTIENTRNALSNLTGSSFQEAAFGMLQLGNLKQLFSKELPSIAVLQSALERRAGRQEMETNRINNNYKRFAEVQQRFPDQMETLGDIAIKASQAEVDILKPYEATTADPAKRVAHGTLQAQFQKLDPEVQDVYKTARKDYDEAFKQYRKIIEDAAENMPGLAAKLKEEFERAHPLVGYTPFLRYGDFWLEFVNPQTDAPVAMSFESIRERNQFIEQNLKGIDHQKYQNFDDVQFNAARVPPTHFISQVITGLRQNKASEAQVNAVYQAYLAAFPAESMAKQFIKRRGIEGMEKDFVRGYGNLMLRWSQKLNNSEFLPEIDKALTMIAQEARNQPPEVAAAAKSILRQTDFFHNPTYNSAVRNATAISFYEYMAGNISSGIVNLTSLPLMVFPMLSGRFGFSAPGALLSAIKTALPGNNWQNDPKYKDLYQRLMEHGQLEHTLAREVLEGRRKKTQDYTGLTAKIADLVSLPFSVSEKWNRASTAIAAYNLELAKTGDKEKAINYALETVRTAHTSGMAVTSPRWMQTAPGRIFFTFKSIIWQQAYVIARAFHQAAKGESKEIRDAARAQLLSTYGMATVFLGVKGMPFYGALSTLIQMLNALFGDDDEPFNLDELLNKTLPMWLNKGLVNYAFNVELSKRAAIANDLIFRDDPRGIAEHGYVLSAMQQAFGPIGSILINSERSIKLFKDGQYYRAFEAASPATIRNVLKGVRYLTEGALTLKGDPIDTDISTYNGLMQIIGFAPADLSDLYEELAIAKQYETAVKARRKFLLRTYEMASRAADNDLLMEVTDKIQQFNETNPRIRITSDTLARSRRATIAAQQSSIHGVRFDKKLLPEIKQRFFEEE